MGRARLRRERGSGARRELCSHADPLAEIAASDHDDEVRTYASNVRETIPRP